MPPSALASYRMYTSIGEWNPNGLGMEAIKRYSELDCHSLDVAWWYGAMTNASAGNASIIRKLFAILWHGGLYYRPNQGVWRPWSDTRMPIATALSRSGGVVIQYENELGNNSLWQWLFAAQQPTARWAATHGIEYGNYGLMPNERPKNFKENKKNNGNHSGINIAGGGRGNINIISGNRIAEDGRHGHLYFCHTEAARNRPGAFLVKAESSAPFDTADGVGWSSPFWRENPNLRYALIAASPIWFGPWLAAFAVDTLTGGGIVRQPLPLAAGFAYPQAQTGDFHALGVSGERGVTGGKKFKSMVNFGGTIPFGDGGYDCMFVNPDDQTVDDLRTGAKGFDEDDLAKSPPAPAAARADDRGGRVNAVLVAELHTVIIKYDEEAQKWYSRSSIESQRVVNWLRDVVATNARNVRIGWPSVQRVEPGDSHLLWTLRYYVGQIGPRGTPLVAEGAPLDTLNPSGRLRKMLAEVVEKGENAAASARA